MSLPGRGHLADSAMVVIAMQWSIVWIIHTPKTHKPAALQLARGTAAIWRGGGPPGYACKFSLLGREDSRRCCHSACLSTCLTFQFACLFDFCTSFASWRFFFAGQFWSALPHAFQEGRLAQKSQNKHKSAGRNFSRFYKFCLFSFGISWIWVKRSWDSKSVSLIILSRVLNMNLITIWISTIISLSTCKLWADTILVCLLWSQWYIFLDLGLIEHIFPTSAFYVKHLTALL